MNILKKVLSNFFIRNFINLFKIFNFEIKIKHDFTQRIFYLMTFQHKGYWIHGKKREKFELERFKNIIKKGDCILEVGGHIGYLTQVFENFAGNHGQVVVVEPDKKNIRILKKNKKKKTIILPIALNDKEGKSNFYLDGKGGFTNSLLSDFNENYDEYYETVIKFNSQKEKTFVKTSTIDAVCKRLSIHPDFVKIDTEGAELNVLKGGTKLLSYIKNLMVEVSRNNKEVYKLLFAHGFHAKDRRGNIIKKNNYKSGNIFFYK